MSVSVCVMPGRDSFGLSRAGIPISSPWQPQWHPWGLGLGWSKRKEGGAALLGSWAGVCARPGPECGPSASPGDPSFSSGQAAVTDSEWLLPATTALFPHCSPSPATPGGWLAAGQGTATSVPPLSQHSQCPSHSSDPGPRVLPPHEWGLLWPLCPGPHSFLTPLWGPSGQTPENHLPVPSLQVLGQ